MKTAIEGIMLLFLSIQDIRKKEISVSLLAIWGILELTLQLLVYKMSLPALLCGFVPGFLCLFISKTSKEAIGYGDGLVLLILGAAVGLQSTVLILMIGCFLLSFLSIYLVTVKKVNKTTTIAFIPFLTVGYLLVLL